MKYESSAELALKADSEGGVARMIFGYGLPVDDLPGDVPAHIRAFVRQLNAVRPSLEAVSRYLDDQLEVAADAYRDY